MARINWDYSELPYQYVKNKIYLYQNYDWNQHNVLQRILKSLMEIWRHFYEILTINRVKWSINGFAYEWWKWCGWWYRMELLCGIVWYWAASVCVWMCVSVCVCVCVCAWVYVGVRMCGIKTLCNTARTKISFKEVK